ncbi:NB-ARC domain-containing protein [Sporosarcina sp. P29]|uniref:NB-ARC domain-containing protein n=1 Tax=Sporosarcina sp. P29 TaxID=2048252 RepID=UPI000C16F467|nr:NB-ARC domain-containing protein [Sporosarcina sp. P29]PIC98215.1 hypothetical protein CSV68_14260 [Sporosarcina sp. P29]
MKFNLSNRVILFSICAALEFDLRQKIISGNKVIISDTLIDKAKSRSSNKEMNLSEILYELDLGDYIEIIRANPYQIGFNNTQIKELTNYFVKIIPIRNRVMHTRPLEVGDRSTLFEVLENISYDLKLLDWQESKHLKIILDEDPTRILESSINLNTGLKDSILHNLPDPEFDDTGYIGRKNEIKHLTDLINNDKDKVISIVGNGGMGKTALTVKILYDLLDSEDSEYEAVLWVSLKTRTLSVGEFLNIENSIKSIPEIYNEIERVSIMSDLKSSEENIIEFLGEFKTLLVLDNLETINTDEFISFLKSIPSKSKVLITSRHGIGELENRFSLSGLNSQDAIEYFRELSKYYGLDLHKRKDVDIRKIITEDLYSNPLSIKWFITSVYKGISEKELINRKGDLVEFCMSNVYDKLSDTARHIIQLFLVEKIEMSIGEMDYFLRIDPVLLRNSINEMLSTNMVKLKLGKYILDDMARDYLSNFYPPSNTFFLEIIKKRKELNSILQTVNTLRVNDPYNPVALSGTVEDTDEKIATYYLYQSLSKMSLNKKRSLLEKAQNIAPSYFEIYKIRAYIESEHRNIYQAVENFEIAVNLTKTKEDKARILLLYATFYVKNVEDYLKAEEIIGEAEVLSPENVDILLEKNRILMRLGKFDECIKNLAVIKNINNQSSQNKDSLIVKSTAEVYRRKAETIDSRYDIDGKITLLKSAIEKMESLKSIDTRNAFTLLNIMTDLSFLYLSNSAMMLLKQTMAKHFDSIKWIKSNDFSKIRRNIEQNKDVINVETFNELIKYVTNFKDASESIHSENEGVITNINNRDFGFIANSSSRDIFFHLNNTLEKVEIGDYVTFDTYMNKVGIAAKNVKKK